MACAGCKARKAMINTAKIQAANGNRRAAAQTLGRVATSAVADARRAARAGVSTLRTRRFR